MKSIFRSIRLYLGRRHINRLKRMYSARDRETRRTLRFLLGEQAVCMHDVDDMSYKEIAELMGVSESYVSRAAKDYRETFKRDA